MYSAEEQQKLIALTTELLKRTSIAISDKEKDASFLHQLLSVIRYHEWRYYVLSEPVIADFEYDQLFSFLVNLAA